MKTGTDFGVKQKKTTLRLLSLNRFEYEKNA
jgi:hypothetical protein